MRRHLRHLSAATLIFGLGGCGIFHPPKPLATTVAPTPLAGSGPDLKLAGDELKGLLLTSGDLPAGYGPMPGGMTGTGPGAMTALGAGVSQCGDAAVAGPSAATVPTSTSQIMYAKGMTGPFVTEAIAAPGDGSARKLVAEVAASPAVCPNFSGDAGGTQVKMSLSQMTVPRYGDASAGVQLVATPSGLPISIRGHVVTFAYRGLAVTVVVMGLSEIDKTEAEAIVTAAERRVRAAK